MSRSIQNKSQRGILQNSFHIVRSKFLKNTREEGHCFRVWLHLLRYPTLLKMNFVDNFQEFINRFRQQLPFCGLYFYWILEASCLYFEILQIFLKLWHIYKSAVRMLPDDFTAWKVSKYRVFYGQYFSVFGLNMEIYAVPLPASNPANILFFLIF